MKRCARAFAKLTTERSPDLKPYSVVFGRDIFQCPLNIVQRGGRVGVSQPTARPLAITNVIRDCIIVYGLRLREVSRRIRRVVAGGLDLDQEWLSLTMLEAGQPHDARQVVYFWITTEAFSESLWQSLN